MKITTTTEDVLQLVGLEAVDHLPSFNLQHGNKSLEAEMIAAIKECVGKADGIYIYYVGDKCVYVGKGRTLLTRLRDHLRESYFEPFVNDKGENIVGMKGDYKTGLWPEFFRDYLGPGEVTIKWVEVENEAIRQMIETALHEQLNPLWIQFVKEKRAERKAQKV